MTLALGRDRPGAAAPRRRAPRATSSSRHRCRPGRSVRTARPRTTRPAGRGSGRPGPPSRPTASRCPTQRPVAGRGPDPVGTTAPPSRPPGPIGAAPRGVAAARPPAHRRTRRGAAGPRPGTDRVDADQTDRPKGDETGPEPPQPSCLHHEVDLLRRMDCWREEGEAAMLADGPYPSLICDRYVLPCGDARGRSQAEGGGEHASERTPSVRERTTRRRQRTHRPPRRARRGTVATSTRLVAKPVRSRHSPATVNAPTRRKSGRRPHGACSNLREKGRQDPCDLPDRPLLRPVRSEGFRDFVAPPPTPDPRPRRFSVPCPRRPRPLRRRRAARPARLGLLVGPRPRPGRAALAGTASVAPSAAPVALASPTAVARPQRRPRPPARPRPRPSRRP